MKRSSDGPTTAVSDPDLGRRRKAWFGPRRGCALGLAALASIAGACTLTSDDFEPQIVDLPQSVALDAGSPPGSTADAATSSTCEDSRGCCVADQDCVAPAQCIGGICQSCADAEGLTTCNLELCPGPNCPTNGAPASCSDGIRNGTEGDIDCGGGCAARCAAGQNCAVNDDCASKHCSAGTCAAASCSDQVLNQSETAVDCGGECPGCGAGAACAADSDCATGLLCSAAKSCSAPSCDDGRQDGTELGVDCGGTCSGCPVGTACNTTSDCATAICRNGACATTPQCADGVTDGTETDLDCGGADVGCARCADGKRCTASTDCQRGNCAGNVCISCQDGRQDGNETGVDCGGNGQGCARCGLGQGCRVAGDCASGICTGNVCVNTSCTNGRRDGNETGVDCGGSDPNCNRCANGSGCNQGSDCASNSCVAGVCSSCGDGSLDGNESDLDCGGTDQNCSRCAPGKLCRSDADCASNACEGGRCCGGTQGDCTRCAERLSTTLDCSTPGPGQDSTGVINCGNFLACLASHPAQCPTRTTPGCSGDPPTDACPHNTYGGNAGTGLTRANQVLTNAGCQL